MGDTVDSSQSMGNAGIVRIHGTNKALAITSDCTPRYVSADPYEGGKQAVAEAYRNLSAVGAKPIAITDNLNFGNPEKPETMGYIVKAIEGMAEACKELDFPVVSGNVSLYNETAGIAIPQTPVVGGVGLIEDLDKVAMLKGAQPGDLLVLIGETKGHLGASLFAREILGLDGDEAGPPPPVDLAIEQRNADFVRNLIERGLVNAVHDVSAGGIACAAAEMALSGGVTLKLSLDDPADDGHEGTFAQLWAQILFGETQGRYLVSCSRSEFARIVELANAEGVRMTGDGTYSKSPLGTAISEEQTSVGFSEEEFSNSFELSLAPLREAHEGWLPSYMDKVD